jgi:hypothetical protein
MMMGLIKISGSVGSVFELCTRGPHPRNANKTSPKYVLEKDETLWNLTCSDRQPLSSDSKVRAGLLFRYCANDTERERFIAIALLAAFTTNIHPSIYLSLLPRVSKKPAGHQLSSMARRRSAAAAAVSSRTRRCC